ncbi:hypothetical protein [Psychrobacillus sp. OK032]|nr:hypothetical protein [Psychrobacillus sp. OK032]
MFAMSFAQEQRFSLRRALRRSNAFLCDELCAGATLFFATSFAQEQKIGI